jgi:formamidopyrimidine-DNA glycosylase
MPELPEVETVRRGLAPAMEGARFKKVETRRKDLRWPLPKDFIKRLEGQKVEGVGRRAKYLTVDVSSGDVLLMHLGMSGSFRVVKDHGKELQPGSYHFDKGKLEKHDHVVFHMSNGSVVTFNDPRRFGSMKIVPRAGIEDEPLLREIGPEPLGNEFDAAMLARACAGKKTSLKAALLDQTVVAGIGNIYACEALFRSHLSPKRTASTIADRSGKPNDRARALVDAIKDVLNDAIKAGGSSLRDHRRADGSLGDFQHNFLVYDREGEPCPGRCKGKIKRFTQNGRSTFWCPSCQK